MPRKAPAFPVVVRRISLSFQKARHQPARHVLKRRRLERRLSTRWKAMGGFPMDDSAFSHRRPNHASARHERRCRTRRRPLRAIGVAWNSLGRDSVRPVGAIPRLRCPSLIQVSGWSHTPDWEATHAECRATFTSSFEQPGLDFRRFERLAANRGGFRPPRPSLGRVSDERERTARSSTPAWDLHFPNTGRGADRGKSDASAR